MYVFITAVCIKKEQEAKIIKYEAGGEGRVWGKGKVHNSSSNNTRWDCSDIAGSKRKKNRKTFATYKTLFTHTHRQTQVEFVCVCVVLCISLYTYLTASRARSQFLLAATLASAAALWVSVVQLLQAIPRSLTARQRRTGQIRPTHTHTHIEAHYHTHTQSHGQADRSDRAKLVKLLLTLRMRNTRVQLNL